MTRKVVISLSPTFGKEVLQENERALQLQVFDVKCNVATKITTEQLISKEGCVIQFELDSNDDSGSNQNEQSSEQSTSNAETNNQPLDGEVVGNGAWLPNTCC